MRRAGPILAVPALLAAACAGPEVAFNPRYEFSSLKRVAVVSFEGTGGSAAADYLAHALLATGAEVVERSRIEAVFSEHHLSTLGALEPATVKEVGKLLAVDALFMGSVTQYAPPQSYLVVEGSSASFAQAVAPVGGPGSTLFSRRPTPGFPGTNIVSSSARVGLAARLVDVETGSVVWSAHQSYEGFDMDCALSAVATSFARSLASHWRR
ncbi:MAG: CsgG/HfaB family protein [Elusimicrobiota bacterium]